MKGHMLRSAMDIEMKVLGPQNEEEILSFERQLLAAEPGDDFEKELSTWKARWRKESLNHYLSLGWSFGIWNENEELKAYVLGQPLLFFQAYTQTLWIEHMAAKDDQLLSKLGDIAYRWARDKHFQRVLFSSEILNDQLINEMKLQKNEENTFELKTAKYK